MRTYIITEASFHVCYLVNMLKYHIPDIGMPNSPYQFIIRDCSQLDSNKLTLIHERLQGKHTLTHQELTQLEEAYHAKLSRAEVALIKRKGVPTLHPLSLPVKHLCTSLNSFNLIETLEVESSDETLSAAIFLDCILKPKWLEIFQQRIINAHSAILPHARGMHAIEQTAATGDLDHFIKSAGASIHYIDERVDMGLLIATKSLENVFDFESIWEVKAASYLTAFELLTGYLQHAMRFSRTDGHVYTDTIGPEFKRKDFTDTVATTAEEQFKLFKNTISIQLSDTDLFRVAAP